MTTEHGSLSASASVKVTGILPLDTPPGAVMAAKVGVYGRLLTSKAPVTAGVPERLSDGVMRNRTLTFVRPGATPSAAEFQTKVWPTPPGEDPSPVTPSPPDPFVAVV